MSIEGRVRVKFHYTKSSFENTLFQTIPCPSEAFFDRHVFIITDRPVLVTFLMATQAVFLMPQITFFLFHTWYHLVYVNSSRVSPATRKMQLKFLIGSFTQVTIPFFAIMVPIFFIWYSINFVYFNQQLNNLISLTFSTHGLLATICMIVVHKSYRHHFISIVTFGRLAMEESPSVRVSAVNSILPQQ